MNDHPDLEDRLRAMFEQRAAGTESHLSGPALRARASRRPSPLRRYAPPLAAAAAVTGLAVGLAIAGSGGGGHPGQVGGSVPPPTVSSPPTHPSTAPTPHSRTPQLSPVHLPAPGRLGAPSASNASSPSNASNTSSPSNASNTSSASSPGAGPAPSASLSSRPHSPRLSRTVAPPPS